MKYGLIGTNKSQAMKILPFSPVKLDDFALRIINAGRKSPIDVLQKSIQKEFERHRNVRIPELAGQNIDRSQSVCGVPNG